MAASPSGLVAGHVELRLAGRPTAAALMDYGRGYLDQRGYVADGFGATANLWVRRDVLERLGGFDAGRRLADARPRLRRARPPGRARARLRAPTSSSSTRRATARATSPASPTGSGRARPGSATTAAGAVRGRRAEWTRPTYWLPWRTIWGLDRLQARGHATTAARRAQLRLVQYACLQVPIAAGSLRGTLREARGAR